MRTFTELAVMLLLSQQEEALGMKLTTAPLTIT